MNEYERLVGALRCRDVQIGAVGANSTVVIGAMGEGARGHVVTVPHADRRLQDELLEALGVGTAVRGRHARPQRVGG